MKATAEQREEFIQALAEMLGGPTQIGFSISLAMGGEQRLLGQAWVKVRNAVPGIFGYPSVEETAALLRDFLGCAAAGEE